jgi:CIC family chloride channel protein
VAEFERSMAEALAVVDNAADLRVLGVLTEANALRRYSEELDQRHRELAGDTWHA